MIFKPLFLSLLLSLVLPTQAEENPFRSDRPDYPRHAAFTEVNWENGLTTVVADGTRGTLISIHGVSTKEILAWCKKHLDPRDAEKRFREDLPVILELMGHKLPIRVEVQLLVDGKTISKKVTMTKANRDALNRRRPKPVNITQSKQLEIFKDILVHRFAYLHANNANWEQSLSELAERLPLPPDQFSFGLHRIMAQFIDGHASVSGGTDLLQLPGNLPFLIEPSKNRFVAFYENRQSLLHDDFPYITHIDGIPLKKWVQVCEPFLVKGSPQYRTRHALRQLRHLNSCRLQLDLPITSELVVTLQNQAGSESTTLTLPISNQTPAYGKWPRTDITASSILDENIAYLRLPAMNDAAVQAIATWMPKFSNTKGLIIDVRDNGGGSRRALLDLAAWFIEKEDAPHVASVAAFRKWDGFAHDHLKARYMARVQSPQWSDADRTAIKNFSNQFKPEWQPDPAAFSDWHYLLLTQPANRPPYTYTKPVVILQNAKCFSATDIFLGALKGWKANITLLGTSSGGGSALSIRHRITEQIQIRCASMASFQSDGLLYDGNGITPDLIIHPEPESFLHGSTDTQLKAAIELISAN